MPASKSQKGRKIGRNKPAAERYRREDRKAKNAVLKQARHLRKIAKFKARNGEAAQAAP